MVLYCCYIDILIKAPIRFEDQLSIVANRHERSPSEKFVLALLGVASRNGVQHDHVKNWIQSSAHNRRLVHALKPETWDRLSASSLQLIAPPDENFSSSSHILVAQRLLASLATHSAGLGPASVKARAVCAVVGLKTLNSGLPGSTTFRDASLISVAEIGVKLGGVRETAKPWVARAKKSKLISQVGSRRGSANAFKVVARRGSSQGGQLATGLARLDATDLVMAVVSSVEHPMISYGMKNGHRMWALLLAHVLEVEPARTGLSDRSVLLVQTDIDRIELHSLSGTGLLERLDGLAQVADPTTGLSPASLAHQAEAFRKARAEERKQAVYEARTQVREDWATELTLRKESKPFDDDTVRTGPLPQGFDPDRHMDRLKEALAQKDLILVRTDRKQWFASPDLFGSPGPVPEWFTRSSARMVHWFT